MKTLEKNNPNAFKEWRVLSGGWRAFGKVALNGIMNSIVYPQIHRLEPSSP
jgi:hypothetical protein